MAQRRRRESSRRHEFRVLIQGIALDPDVLKRINQGVQKAVLTELASLDMHGDFAARIGDGGTQGIELIALSPDQMKQVGIEADSGGAE